MNTKKILNWNVSHAILMLFASASSLLFNNILILTLPAFVSFIILIVQNFQYLKNLHPFGGRANHLTFFRLVLISVTAIGYSTISYHTLFVLFGTNIILDVVDGKLARQYNQQSFFGQYFDMETDAFFIAIVCHVLYLTGLVGGWIIIIGLLRYINVFAYVLLNIQHYPEPKRKYASYIAGLLFLAVLLPFLSQQKIISWFLISASIAVCMSFAISFKYQLTANAKHPEKASTKQPTDIE